MRSEPAHSHRIVAIETSGAAGSVAVAQGPDCLAVRDLTGRRDHAVGLLPAIDALTRQVGWRPSDIDEIHVSAGPGSFTGLRIGITVARTLALATGVRIVPVPSLEVLARNALGVAPSPAHLAVILDAKRAQVYGAVFALDQDRYETIVAPCVIDPDQLWARVPRPLAVLGDGITQHREAVDRADLQILPERLWQARAEHVHALGHELALAGKYADPRTVIPFYLRRPEAEEKWEQRHPEPERPHSTG